MSFCCNSVYQSIVGIKIQFLQTASPLDCFDGEPHEDKFEIHCDNVAAIDEQENY